MLTKSVNKVYLLSYNACESQGLPALEAKFQHIQEVLILPQFHTITVSLHQSLRSAFQSARNHRHLNSSNSGTATFLPISPANQYYTLLH